MDLLHKARKHQYRAEYYAAESRHTSTAMLTGVQFVLVVGFAMLVAIGCMILSSF